jgi:hypothetical protein
LAFSYCRATLRWFLSEALMIRENIPEPSMQNTEARTKPVSDPTIDIPFMQRPTCTIKEACKASGMGRT